MDSWEKTQKPVDLVTQPWDFLIILDACRYDYFANTYSRFIQGELTKRVSPGSCTNQWRDRCFPDRYDDVVYISANPQINKQTPVYGYCAGEHFHEVIEVWRDRWSYEKATVLPETVTGSAIETIPRYPGKRFIIHYMQPHAPYITLQTDSKWYTKWSVAADAADVKADPIPDQSKNLWLRARKKIFSLTHRCFAGSTLLGNHPDWMLRRFFRLPVVTPMEEALRRYGRGGLRQGYQRNLELALRQVAELLRYLSGTVVITTDHGELLGEKNNYSHPPNSQHPILREIPWLLCQRGQAELMFPHPSQSKPDQSPQTDQADLASKLKSLGYYD